MVPAVSCPNTRGGGAVPNLIFLMAVGHTPQAATFDEQFVGADARQGQRLTQTQKFRDLRLLADRTFRSM